MSNRRRTAFVVVGVIVVIFVIFQLVPWGSIVPAFARTNPPVATQIQWDSAQTEQLMRTTCYDCHSNETVWPWYAQIAPVSWLVAKDVNEGRENLNLSLHTADQIDSDELVEELEEGAMPPSSYKILHPDANLSEAQKSALISGLRASLHGTEEGNAGEGNESGESGESGEQGETDEEDESSG